jgi:antitoxin VapB
MLQLSRETEALAQSLAAASGLSVDETIRRALVRSAAIRRGVAERRHRATVEEMLAVGREISALPLLDARSPNEIIDDLNDLNG